MYNPVRFHETQHEHVFRLTGSPRGNTFLGARRRTSTPNIMREESAREGIHANGSPVVWSFGMSNDVAKCAMLRAGDQPEQDILRLRGSWQKNVMVEALVIFHTYMGEGHIKGQQFPAENKKRSRRKISRRK